MSGLLQLIRFVEEDLQNAMALESYYRSTYPDELYRREIIK